MPVASLVVDASSSVASAELAVGVPLEIDSVSRVFSDGTGLHPSSLSINAGEFISVLGPSGCGKSTLLRLVAGLERPQAGRILFGDRVVCDVEAGVNLAPRRRRIGMVFQDLALWPHLTAFENAAFPLRVAGGRDLVGSVRDRVDEALDTVGLSRFATKLPHQLSGGQQQRVAVARAIVSRPDVLLMDEPFSALDTALKVQLRAELKALTSTIGVTTIFVTHDQEEAMGLSDRIAVLFDGEVRQFSAPQDLYERPADERVADFIGDFNRLPGRAAGLRPEKVRLTDAADHADTAVIDATVRSCDYRGGHFRVSATVDGVDRPWVFASATAQTPDAVVRVQYHPADVIDFSS